ncbi:MAG: efflux RND transporter periplasmic adaptor subunit [Alphaproteobacteria bacterium]
MQKSLSRKPHGIFHPKVLIYCTLWLCVAIFSWSRPALSQPAGPPPVGVRQPVVKSLAEWMEFTGQFTPQAFVEVRARVSGALTEIHFHDGQIVAKGDLLFVVDPRPYEIALAVSKAHLDQQIAALELAKRQLSRGGALRQKDVLAQSDYDIREQQMRGAAAAVESARANVREAQLNLEFTRITAPITGRVGLHMVSVGNLITGGVNIAAPTLLTTIITLDPVILNFDMSETDFLTLQRAASNGQLASLRDSKNPIHVRLTDETEWRHEGSLEYVDNQISRNTGTIRVGVNVPNPNHLITPGQFGRVRLAMSAPRETILVPDSATVTDQSRKLVMTVSDDGTVVPRVVTLGPMIDGLRVVREGLGAGEKVIVSGLMRARPGAKVTPTPADAEPGK